MRRDIPVDEAEIRRYLLGELPEGVAVSLEHAYFADPDVLARVELAEADLVDDYVAGRLTPQERETFERYYLATPEHRDEVAVARSLRKAVAAGDAAPAASAAPAAGTRRTVGPSGAAPWWRWAAAAATVIVVVGVAWRASRAPITSPGVEETRPSVELPRGPSARVEAPTTAATPRTSEPTAPTPPKTVTVALRLSPDVTRGEGQPAMRAIPPGATHVELQFQTERQPVEGLRAQLAVVDGGVVWTGSVLPERTGAARASTARVIVPARLLLPGDYVLSVSPPGPPRAEGPQQFYFRIVPR